MAHIRLEAALETSDKWQITDASLLRWRMKLKRSAQECDDILHKTKQQILEEEQIKWEVKNSSLPNRFVHATKSFVSSLLNRNSNELSIFIAQRFEWYAYGASEFLRFIELGGTPRYHMPFDSLVKNLYAGKVLHHKIVRGNKYPSFQLWLEPVRTLEHGTNACLTFVQYDGTLESHIFVGLVVQLSESTDIFGIALRCLQFFSPHFKCNFENIWNELTQLSAQEFSWGPSMYSSYHKKHWDKFNSFVLQWTRPNPFCCKQHNMAGISEILLEPVINFNLNCQVSMSVYCKQKTSLSEDIICMQEYPYLKAGISFAPHGSLEDMLPVNRSSEIAVIVHKEQHCLHTDITLEQLEDIMLPKAMDCFHQNAEAMVYQMLWKSKHGFAHIQPCMSMRRSSMRTQRTFGGDTQRKLLQGHDKKLIRNRIRVYHLVDLWATHAPVQLQKSIMNWKQKEKEILLSAPQLHLKF
ncbi:hypothetical protein PVAP13_2KG216216 [Panicum virgatum]|uniref:Uncharacterized protein n=1 Tax=Panicum virgatum TaxID=38727 RepID=A0A8T0VXF8_PANVG|nr:hypothetical protein PVAP13_2KG216216 [Panicum virgatum]